jgi:Cupin-like domain
MTLETSSPSHADISIKTLMNQQRIPKSKLLLPEFMIQKESDTSLFTTHFNRSSFVFSHNLAEHPLFELSRIAELAETILVKGNPAHFTYFYNTGLSAGSQYREMQPKEKVAEAIAHIKESSSWLKLTSIHEVDSDYQLIIDQFIGELEDVMGVPLRQEITWMSPTLFVASPHTVTPYHIDHECNFLLQVRGSKEVNLFDPHDRSVLTEQEVERYYIGDGEAVSYREENQPKASVYQLTPGLGVHHPIHAPHWVKNGNDVSIALSIGFCTKSSDLQARIYQTNHYLRKLKLQPTPPGKSRIKDKIKIYFIGMLTKHNPTNRHEVMHSGIETIKAPAKLIQRIMN